MKIAIVGAGVAGLTTAKVLLQAGHQVEVFDRTPDVGGVWSSTRRYPGLTTQSPAAQYSFSDYPMPKRPEWPTGAQVQAYLASYAAHFGVEPCLRLGTTVDAVEPADGVWNVVTRTSDAAPVSQTFDRVVVANGVFCEPAMPSYPGREEFEGAGGRLVAGSEVHDAEESRDKHVVVVGYGKSACDVTVALSSTAATTDVIARQMLWKVPRKIAGVVNFKMLLLTRMGEALFPYLRLRGAERFLHGPGDRLRRGMLNSIGSVSVRQFGLQDKGLVPRGAMEDIVRGAIGLATEGFYEGVEDGTIRVSRDTTITRLLADDLGRPCVELVDGTVLPADLVVCATGFSQGVPFLDRGIADKLFDERGNFMLYRQVQPLDVPGLYFNGYNSSFFSPLNAEMAALWIAADLAGSLDLPDPAARRAAVVEQLAFMDEATDGHHCRGTKIIPFSMKNLDEVLSDLGVQISPLVRASHWLNPIDPAAYQKLTPAVLATLPPALPPAPTTEGTTAWKPPSTFTFSPPEKETTSAPSGSASM